MVVDLMLKSLFSIIIMYMFQYKIVGKYAIVLLLGEPVNYPYRNDSTEN